MRRVVLILGILLFTSQLYSQERIELWGDGALPNSRGMELQYSEERELITQVDTPALHAFYPSNREISGAAVVICPPGGYTKLAYNVAGHQLAKWFNTIGVTAYVLIYRLPNSPDLIHPEQAPLQDAQRAIKLIRSRAAEFGIDPTRIGVMGSSSGGHVAATLSTIGDDYSRVGDSLDEVSPRPDFTILVSPVVSMTDFAHEGSVVNLLGDNPTKRQREQFSAQLRVDPQSPPAFMVHAQDDHVVSVQNTLLYYSALCESGVGGCSLHIFPSGRHSIALRNSSAMLNEWTRLCEGWLVERKIITKR